MPKVTANNYATHYELDDFTAPWKTPETIWIQHGFGRSSRFWYHWVPPLAGAFQEHDTMRDADRDSAADSANLRAWA